MKKLSIVFCMLTLIIAMSTALMAAGTQPPINTGGKYAVSSLDHLLWISTTSSSWDKNFIQTDDIDATTTSAWNAGKGLSPIGNSSTRFTGSYDGGGYSIEGLFVNRPTTNYIGLFGYIYRATIENLGLTNINITGGDATGGLVGYSYISALSKCYSTGSVSGDWKAGGLVGENSRSTLNNCYSTGSVSGTYSQGGLVGDNSKSKINNCYSTGNVSGHTFVGGLVGQNDTSTVSNSFWDTQTSNQSNSAGGTGKTTVEMKTLSTFTDAGWDFDVDGLSAGSNGIWIMAGYPHLQMEWSARVSNLVELQLVALDLDATYTQTANIDASATSTWNYNGATYEGFSPIGNYSTRFTGSYDGGGHAIDNLYIYRPSINYIGLFGYADGATIQNLGVTNIDITGYAMTGGLMGFGFNNGTVSNSYSTGNVSGNTFVGGLIGATKNSAVSNSYSTVNVVGANYVGGLAAGNESSTLSNSYTTGSVSGTSYTGGFVGYSYINSTVSNCYTTGNVTRRSGSDTHFGGFCGYNNESTIEYSYSIGDVSYTGATNPSDKGFVGDDINSCSYNNNFWDSQSSNQSTGPEAYATGKTTTEMKTLSTFINAGWDFIGEDLNGTDEIWNIANSRNDNYPYFQWQYPDDPAPSYEGATPITLSSFSAKVEKGKLVITWETASETNNAAFIVYRNDEALARIEGAGTTSKSQKYTFVDDTVIPGVTYTYVLADVDYANKETKYEDQKLDITIPEKNTPMTFTLNANYPNPFNPSTSIDYTVAETQNINLSIFNMKGEKVTTLFDGERSAGHYSQTWNAVNVQSGVYLLRARSAGQVRTQKLLLLK
jgi:hypothetical protein